MTLNKYTALTNQLKTVSNQPSDSGNRRGYSQARAFIMESDLSDAQKELVRAELHKAADNNQGYHYNSNGVHGALEAIAKLEAANDDLYEPQPPTPLSIGELMAKVESGKIFGVSFIKRTTGELRTMSCRLGVKKFLHGGKMAYSPAEKKLLTVFSMSDKGYRSIPFEGIQSVSVGGQSYSLAGV